MRRGNLAHLEHAFALNCAPSGFVTLSSVASTHAASLVTSWTVLLMCHWRASTGALRCRDRDQFRIDSFRGG